MELGDDCSTLVFARKFFQFCNSGFEIGRNLA
jgi:hypothetical protein